MNKILAAIDIVTKLLGTLVIAKPNESKDYALVSELLTQLKTLGEEALSRLFQRMNYVREVLSRNVLPSFGYFKEFLDEVDAIATSDFITYHVSVKRSCTPEKALSATGREQCVNDEIVANMPRGEGDKVEVVFFNLGRSTYDNELEKEYKLRGLVSCDPYSLAAVNEADPEFANTHPNSTHWMDANGNWCHIVFDAPWHDERNVDVYRYDFEWHDYWWFAGLRK